MDKLEETSVSRSDSVVALDISCRARDCLHNSFIAIIDELLAIGKKELKGIEGIGPKTYKEIVSRVHANGFKFIDD